MLEPLVKEKLNKVYSDYDIFLFFLKKKQTYFKWTPSEKFNGPKLINAIFGKNIIDIEIFDTI